MRLIISACAISPYTDRVDVPDLADAKNKVPLILIRHHHPFPHHYSLTLCFTLSLAPLPFPPLFAQARRVMAQLRDICATLTGLCVATNYEVGQRVLDESDFKQHRVYFQSIFELCRRHKIRNPG